MGERKVEVKLKLEKEVLEIIDQHWEFIKKKVPEENLKEAGWDSKENFRSGLISIHIHVAYNNFDAFKKYAESRKEEDLEKVKDLLKEGYEKALNTNIKW